MSDSCGESRLKVVEISPGRTGSARVVVVLRLVHERFGSIHAERVNGPWRDERNARAELERIGEAMTAGDLVVLDWLVARRRNIVAAFIETEVSLVTGR